jgi:hypothetical protein
MNTEIVLIIVIILVLLYLLFRKKQENYAPYYSILAPEIINTSPSFDYPNLFGEVTNPYAGAKTDSQNRLFTQLHALYTN